MSRHRQGARLSILATMGVIALGFPLVAAATVAEPAVQADVPLDELRVVTVQVASGLQRPTAIAIPADGSGRLLIAEKRGTVRAFQPDTGLAPAPVLDISGRVSSAANERGLLGIVAAPDFAQTSLVYLAYTRLTDNALTLSRIPLNDATREEVLLTQDHARFGNHNGGQLAFGPDGFLYWSLGDGGGAGDPLASGQSLGTLLGKILRLDVGRACPGLAYCIPEDNPFVGVAGARGEIWTYGLRNPWRFSFDSAGGSLWIADVGQGTFEEVNHQPAGQGGVNFGWSCMEGPEVFNAERCEPDAVHVDPVFHYQTSVDGCAVIGGHVYRGQQFADLAAGTYVATDYCSSIAWAVRENPDGSHSNARIGQYPTQVTSFGVDAAGELYVVNDLPGQLHRVGFEHVPAA
jgi:glucose/arabinose dehydrogenase